MEIAGYWRGHLLALSAGLILPFAFAPFQFYPIALVSLTLLFLSWHQASVKIAVWRGLLFGLAFFGLGVSWVYVAIHVFGQASPILAALLTGLFVFIFASYLAGLAWLVKRLSHGQVFTAYDYLLLLPVAWLGFEVFKGWFLTGFPWLELGTSQITGPMAGYIPIIGVIGTSYLLAVLAGLLAMGFSYKCWKVLPLVVAIIALGQALKTSDWTLPSGQPLTVSIIQGNVAQSTKWDQAQILNTMRLYQQKTAENWTSDLIVWPENAITAFYHQAKSGFFDPLAEQARKNDSEILLGLPVYDFDTEKYYNSLLLMGENHGLYHKRHLVPFGDYLPFEWLRGLIAFFDLPMSSFSPGKSEQSMMSIAGHPVGLSVCYEDTFSSEVITALPEAGFLVNATNNAWYGNSFAPHQHLQISQSRALETGRSIIRATTNGISAFIDHRGKINSQTAQFQQQVLTGSVQPRRGATPYVTWQYRPLLLFTLSMLIVWAYYRFSDVNRRQS